MAAWQRKFAFDPPLTISVNISTRHLNDAGLLEDVEHALSETVLDPKCLKLEITEGAIMQNPERALATLRRLKLMNIGLEIDDFGIGYSSLSYLQRLPFDTIKIDRSFIKELGVSAESTEIVRTIVELARSLEMEVVAEGVETEDQFQKVTSLGCEYVQGYYFAKSAAAQTTQTLMAEREELQRAFAMLQGESSVEPMPRTQVLGIKNRVRVPGLVQIR
jgi:EAL domain-containing protein (putative c-di-GMP-specific phosphodiesterase class I)